MGEYLSHGLLLLELTSFPVNTNVSVKVVINEELVSTVIAETFTLQDLCRQILNETEHRPSIPSGALGPLIDRCQCFKVHPPVLIRGRANEDVVAECQDRVAGQREVAKSTEIGDVVQGAPRRCVPLVINLTGELMKIIPKIRD